MRGKIKGKERARGLNCSFFIKNNEYSILSNSLRCVTYL